MIGSSNTSRLLRIAMKTWPMLPLLLVLLVYMPWSHGGVVSETHVEAVLAFHGQPICQIKVTKSTLLDWTETDDYKVAIRRFRFAFGQFTLATWQSIGLVTTTALLFWSRTPLDYDSSESSWPPLRSFLACLVIGSVLVVMYQSVWPLLTGQEFAIGEDLGIADKAFSLSSFLLFYGSLWVLAPIAEEIVFRAWLQKLLDEFMPQAMAMVVTALAFGGLHWNQGVAGAIQTAFLAFVSGTLYLKTGKLWTSVAIHSVANILGSIGPIMTWLLWSASDFGSAVCLHAN